MGIFDQIKSVVGLEKKEDKEFRETLQQSIRQYEKVSNYFYNITFSEIQIYNEVVKKWDDHKKADFIVFLTSAAEKKKSYRNTSTDPVYKEIQMAYSYIQTFFKSRMKLPEEKLLNIYQAFCTHTAESDYYNHGAIAWPLAGWFKQVEFNFPDEAPESIKKILNEILSFDKKPNVYYYKDHIKLEEKIKSYLHHTGNGSDAARPVYFLGEDAFRDFANDLINGQKEKERSCWFELMALAQKASGGKPSQKFLNEAKEIIDRLGSDKFKKVIHDWFRFIIDLKESVTQHEHRYNNRVYTYRTSEFLSALNADAVKGFVWMSSWFHDNATIQVIGKLAERCFKKIPEKGPAAAGIGNACLYTLYASKGLDGIAQLSRLKLKIKQNNTLNLIEKYIREAAEKLKISSSEIEDLAVDDFKLKDHKITYETEGYTCVLELTGIGKSVLRWFKPDGSEQKSVPQAVKDNAAAKLKKIRDTQKQIDQTTSSQKERFDRMMRSSRVLSLEYFKEKYLNHGLLSYVIGKVIFKFSKEKEERLAVYLKGEWIDIDYNMIDIEQYDTVSLWHPVTSGTAEVKAWRQFLMEGEIQQPFKQAYREIYLLTDAEINTRTYSNRMASHILKQHQYVTLAKGRNWKARLIGAWDGGDSDTAELMMPEYHISVEYWVNALNAHDEFNATGIWNYVTTDQIRFINTETREVMNLIDVPAIAFSEAMRDVDLFVGVASVGNDPAWSDSGGLPAYRDYWQSYSFGNLSEIAKNRKEILRNLIPRLKITSVTHIEDKFVVVKGKIRTYKIHIGSTNILMEPNDQYLCIVPDRSKKDTGSTLFLPFEGDNGLSVIISKALLLANDDKITDSTITSQIGRK